MPMTPLSSGRNNALDVDDLLMPSTPLAYPQVAWRRLASFRVIDSSISAGQLGLCAWFDSRELHQGNAGQGQKPWPAFFFRQHFINIGPGCREGITPKEELDTPHWGYRPGRLGY
jgi:hypothetical protein